MPAPSGNSYWLKRTTYGREKLFESPAGFFKACVEYFEYVDSTPMLEYKAMMSNGEPVTVPVEKPRPYTFIGLCLFLDITQQTLNNYENRKGYEDYFEVVTKVKDIIRDQKYTGASSGLFNSNIIARDLGLSDKQDHSVHAMTHEEWLDTLK